MNNTDSKMFGSIHTHFEDFADTANDLRSSLAAFGALGAKKVAATGHGVFSEYEDLVDAAEELASSGVAVPEVVPGVECYFGDTKAHMVLIAKDEEGYRSLSRIITESNRNYNEVPIVTMENLRANVAKGHVVATTACVGGVVGQRLGMSQHLANRPLEKKRAELERISEEAAAAEELMERYASAASVRKPPKAERDRAERRGDVEALEALEEALARYNEAQSIRKELAPKREAAKKLLAKRDALIEQITAGEAGINTDYVGIMRSESAPLVNELVGIFGRDDFYFEIQNHGLDFESVVYRNVVRLALAMGMEDRLIASNDVHICAHSSDPGFGRAVERRRVARFLRYGKYSQSVAPREDDGEYGIKTDAELRDALVKMLGNGTIRTASGKTMSCEELADVAVGNIENVLSKCSVKRERGSYYPKFCDNENEEFERLIAAGAKEKFPDGFPSAEYREALEHEMDVIKKMGYAGYHLIVQDYLRYGRLLGYLLPADVPGAPLSTGELEAYVDSKYASDPAYAGFKGMRTGMGIGPGRGSAVGSLCCYLLGITDIDPIKHGLLFERFLNPERVSMPDIDSDFRTDIRAKVYEYTAARYGEDCVCNIMTKSYASGKKSLQIASRYLAAKKTYESGLEKGAAEAMAKKYVGILRKLSETYSKFERGGAPSEEILRSAEFRAAASSGPEEAEVVDLAIECNGMFTGYGQHAAGVVISSAPLDNIIPLAWNETKGTFQTQCLMAQAEEKGLLKMDQLGLKNLDIITEIIARPSSGECERTLLDPKTREAALSDAAVYRDVFAAGLTQGVFQFESEGMKKMLKDFCPESIEDIILLVAAYRPGPMEYIPEIIASKWHEKDPASHPAPKRSITLKNDALEKILAPTYGVPIYQEQIMKIFQDIAGYSLGGADIVRRYMSKKKMDKLAHERDAFIHGDASRSIEGAVAKQGLSEEDAGALFDQMIPFGKYGFNKSHATAYAYIAFYTAYLKKYRTADFFRSSLNAMDAVKDYAPYFAEAESFGIKILPPSMMSSKDSFSVEVGPDGREAVRFGISKIKGVSSTTFRRSPCVEDFVMKNPHVPIATVEVFATLGMFQSRTLSEYENIKAAHVGRGDVASLVPSPVQVADFVRAHGRELLAFSQASRGLAQAKEAVAQSRDEISEEAYAAAEKAFESAKKKLGDLGELEAARRTPADTVAQRGAEEELLGDVLNTDAIAASLRAKYGSSVVTLEDARKRVVEKGEQTSVYDRPVHLAVLSQKPPVTTKSGRTYYPAVLMDAAGEKIERRFSSPLEITESAFKLPSDRERFWATAEAVATEVETGEVARTARKGAAAPHQDAEVEFCLE